MHPIPVIADDSGLRPYESQIRNRMEWFFNTMEYIDRDFGSLYEFSGAHLYFGFNYDAQKKGWFFREWAPNASQVFLIGDFNDWQDEHPLERQKYGVWEIFLPDADFKDKKLIGSRVRLKMETPNMGTIYRVPAFMKAVKANEKHLFDGLFLGHSDFKWTDQNFKISEKHPLIYECHIGMATEEYRVGTYREFADEVLPRIWDLGYNAVQMMGIMEHPYYGSFGYQVSNFFAPSSRFGSPDDLRYLINKAHEMGIACILDVVHSHSVKNLEEGLGDFDGTDLYFNGWHPAWDSRLFDYGRIEVKRFLCSNIRYWLEEFHFDGFRFDGVTSMLYHNHGHTAFTHYDDYFHGTNNDAILYLQLANTLIHEINPKALSICEDMSGMPGACRKIEDGGLGFDYRLSMGLPDFWTKTMEEQREEDWQMGDWFWQLTQRRFKEKNIGYVESHDQVLVGDKSIAFWLMDADMYTGMSILTENLTVDRGIALHEMFRLITVVLSGEGYMNFMGNEFGHPEWVDFPREGNEWSYHYARRQWSLVDADHLRYQYLNNFDKAMIHFVKNHDLLGPYIPQKLLEDNDNKVLGFSKNQLVFLFNFGPNSIEHYQFYTGVHGYMEIVFSSDDQNFGGFDRVDKKMEYPSVDGQCKIYLPSRTALVLKKIN